MAQNFVAKKRIGRAQWPAEREIKKRMIGHSVKVFLVFGAMATLVGGCEMLDGAIRSVSVEPAVKVYRDSDDRIVPIDLDTYKLRGSEPYYGHANRTEEMRNELQEAIFQVSQVTCTNFRKRLYALHGGRKIFFQGGALLLSGAATAVGGVAAKTILSGLSTAVLGIDETIDANVLQDQAISAVLNTIQSERSQLLSDIRNDKQKRLLKYYSMQAAVGDAIRYNKLCSLTEAISKMSNATQQKTANARIIKQVRIDNLRLRLEKAENYRGELKADNPNLSATDLAFLSRGGRVDRLEKQLKAMEGATSDEAVNGVTPPEE